MPNYNEFVLELQSEIERLGNMRDKADEQILRLYAAIKAIESLAADSDQPIIEPPELSEAEERGFTDQVRALFKANPATAFTAVAIRNHMLESDPKADPKITLIHAHNTVRRLVRQDEISETQRPDGRIGYTLKPPKLAPVVDLMVALKESLAKIDRGNAAPENQSPQFQGWRKRRKKRMRLAAAAALENLNTKEE